MFQSFVLIALGLTVIWYGLKLRRVDRRFHDNAVRTEATVVAPRVKVPGGTTDQMMHVEFTDSEGRTVYAATVCDPPKPAEGDRIEVLYDPSRPGSGALPATRAGRSSPLPRIVLAIGAGLLVLAVVVGWDFYTDLAGLIGFLLR